jgi:hypothetical protein
VIAQLFGLNARLFGVIAQSTPAVIGSRGIWRHCAIGWRDCAILPVCLLSIILSALTLIDFF